MESTAANNPEVLCFLLYKFTKLLIDFDLQARKTKFLSDQSPVGVVGYQIAVYLRIVTMKPKPRGRSSDSTEQSCYDFTKLKEALHLAQNSLINNLAVNNDTIARKNEGSASCVYDFSKVAEALAMLDQEARDDLAPCQRLVIGRRSISRTKKRRDDELLKVKKAEHKMILKEMKTKRWKNMFLFTLKSLKNCS